MEENKSCLLSEIEKFVDLGEAQQIELYTDILSETKVEEQLKKTIKLLIIILNDQNHPSKTSKPNQSTGGIPETSRLLAHLQHFVSILESFSMNSEYLQLFIANKETSSKLIPRSFFAGEADRLKEFLNSIPDQQFLGEKSYLSDLRPEVLAEKLKELRIIQSKVENSTNISELRNSFQEICTLFELASLLNDRLINKIKEDNEKDKNNSINTTEMDEKIRLIETEVNELKEKCQIAENEKNNLFNENSELKKQIKVLKNKKISKREVSGKDKSELAQNMKNMEKIKIENKELKQKIKLFQAKTADSSNEGKFKEEIERLKKQISDLEELKTKLSENTEESLRQISLLQKENQNLKKLNENCMKDLSEKKGKQTDENELNGIKEENLKLKKRLNEFESNLNSLKNENEKMKKNSNCSTNSKKENKKLKNEILCLTNENKSLQNQINKEKDTNLEISKKNEEMIFLSNSIRSEFEILKSEKERTQLLENENIRLKQQIDDLIQSLSQIKEKFLEVKKKASQENEVLQTKVELMSQQKRAMKEMIKRLQKNAPSDEAVSETINTLEVEKNDLKRRNEKLIKNIELLKTANNEIADSYKERIREIKELKKEIARIRSKNKEEEILFASEQRNSFSPKQQSSSNNNNNNNSNDSNNNNSYNTNYSYNSYSNNNKKYSDNDNINNNNNYNESKNSNGNNLGNKLNNCGSNNSSRDVDISVSRFAMLLAGALSQPLRTAQMKSEVFRMIEIVKSEHAIASKMAAASSSSSSFTSIEGRTDKAEIFGRGGLVGPIPKLLPQFDDLDREIMNLQRSIKK